MVEGAAGCRVELAAVVAAANHGLALIGLGALPAGPRYRHAVDEPGLAGCGAGLAGECAGAEINRAGIVGPGLGEPLRNRAFGDDPGDIGTAGIDLFRAGRLGASVPLSFEPGEAYQFDWSHEVVVLGA